MKIVKCVWEKNRCLGVFEVIFQLGLGFYLNDLMPTFIGVLINEMKF